MVPEMEKPGVTEIKVRMDCNGCVQKIKKALHGITGIHDIYVDFSQQKITIIGRADPEKIVKAIKKTRKSAVICLHTEPPQPEPKPEEAAPPPDPTNPPPEPTQPQPPPEPPKEPPPPKNPPRPDPNPSPEIANATPSHSEKPHKPHDHEEIHVIHHHPPDYGYRYAYGPNLQQGHNGQYNSYHGGPHFGAGPSRPPQPPQPVYVTHGYNTYKPSPYVTEYAYPQSPPMYSRYSVPEYDTRYSMPDNNTRYSVPRYDIRHSMPDYNTRYSATDYYSRDSSSENNGNGNGNGNITSMFSEENPNACRIM